MKAIGYRAAGAADTLEIFDADRPEVRPRDLLVEVRGVSVNPVDVKLRAAVQPEDGARILGFDAAGVVVAVVPECIQCLPAGLSFKSPLWR